MFRVPLLQNQTVQSVRRHWLTFAFFLGFILDNITLNRVDQLFDNLVLAFYVLLAMASLLLLYAGSAEKLPEKWVPYARLYAPFLIQFSFGGLLSGMLIFYSRSGSWLESWPFLLIILAVIYGNERIKDRSSRLIFNLTVLFIGLFSYVVLLIPVLTGKMGVWIFIASGVVSLFVMYLFMRLLSLIVPRFIEIHQRSIVFTIGCIFAVLNILYFTNIIPPIPLSLKDVGIYHSVVRFDNNEYQLKYEKPAWWQFFRDSNSVFHYKEEDNVFCFASVFAPTRLSTDIYHRWQKYDEELGKWVDHARLSYPIAGGRGSGFRGYTLIQNYSDGKWRCRVETERGQVLGTETFMIASGEGRELITRMEEQ